MFWVSFLSYHRSPIVSVKGFHHNSPQNPATMDNLPEDVLSYILIRLRAKQLAQMRCISKSLTALLSQSYFVKSHLNHSIHNNDGVILFFSKIFSCDSKSLTAFDLLTENSGVKVIGSVNGLICFKYGSQHGSEVIYIWNPSLTALLTLPMYIPSHSYILTNFRFGFDPKTDDYKLVKLTQVHITNIVINEWMQVEVYSMRKGSWELITQRIPSHITYIFDSDYVCVDGHDGYLHWLAETDFGWNAGIILSFDLDAHTFREIPFPDSIQDDKVSTVLGVLAGKLCVMSRVVPDGECEVWVMDKYGVAESWVKHLVVPPFSGYANSYGFTLQNEFLFRVFPHGLALYDPVSGKTKSFEFHSRFDMTGKVFEYVDSLVWVTPAKKHDMSCCTNS